MSFPILFKKLFMYFWPCQVFVGAHSFSLFAGRWSYPPVAVHRLLIVVAFLAAEHGLGSCGTQA